MDPIQDRYAVEKANQYISYLVSHELQLEIADRVQYRPFIAALNNTGGIFKIIEDKCKTYLSLTQVKLGNRRVPYSLALCNWFNVDSSGKAIARYHMVTCSFYDPIEEKVQCHPLFWTKSFDCPVKAIHVTFADLRREFPLNRYKCFSAVVPANYDEFETLPGMCGTSRILRCFATDLNNVGSRPFRTYPKFKELIESVKSVVEALFVCEGIHETLQGEEELLLFLETGFKTWTATYDQLDRYLRHANRIEELLRVHGKQSIMPVRESRHMIKDAVKVYKPLRNLAKHICEDQFFSASLVIPSTRALMAAMHLVWPVTAVGRNIRTFISTDIMDLFASIEEYEIYALATLIDPRYKAKPFRSPLAKEAAINILKSNVIKLDTYMDDQEQYQNAVSAYLASETMDVRDPNPLGYFQKNYIALKPVAKRYLVIQAIAGPPDKIFGEGLNVPRAWANYKPDDLKHLMLVAQKMKFKQKE